MKNKEKNSFSQIEELKDFLEFKNTNELTYCTFLNTYDPQEKGSVSWLTTKKYNTTFLSIIDVEKIEHELLNLMIETKSFGKISKITCSENCHIVEFVFYPKKN